MIYWTNTQPMEIEEYKSLKDLSSMKIGGTSRYFGIINTIKDVEFLDKLSKDKNLPLTIIGSGTNSIFKDGELNHVLGLMNIEGIRIIKDFGDRVQIEAGAGVLWDDLVDWAVEHKLSGIEAMSAIPGTCGASPIQNIGAYGSELADTFVNVKAYDRETSSLVLLGLNDCKFSYRDSIFKHLKNRYIITSLTLELSTKSPELPKYKDVQMYFLGQNKKPSLKQIRKAIIEIRKRKLPQPEIIPNVGSFFKNPIVPNHEAQNLLQKYPEMPHFEEDKDHVKLYAGWFIEQAGFKGAEIGPITCYKDNALVLTSPKDATFKELEEAYKKIIRKVKETFGVTLEMEPNIIG